MKCYPSVFLAQKVYVHGDMIVLPTCTSNLHQQSCVIMSLFTFIYTVFQNKLHPYDFHDNNVK